VKEERRLIMGIGVDENDEMYGVEGREEIMIEGEARHSEPRGTFIVNSNLCPLQFSVSLVNIARFFSGKGNGTSNATADWDGTEIRRRLKIEIDQSVG
jgi:hypothetical protein